MPAAVLEAFHEAGVATLQLLVPRVAGEHLDAPRTVQLSGDVSHRLESGWLFRARYSHRSTDNSVVVKIVPPPNVVSTIDL